MNIAIIQLMLVNRCDKMECAFVDLQGFSFNKNSFAVKEICILTKNIKFHEFVKPPFPFSELIDCRKRQVEWLEKNYHGLNWDAGYITLQELKYTISPIVKGKILLVKGYEKVKWMQNILNDENIVCINMEDINCDLKLSEPHIQSVSCSKHNNVHHSHCARNNAAMLKYWFYTHSVYSKTVKSLIQH